MADFKLNLSHKGKSVQREVKEADASVFLGKKIGDKIKGDDCGLAGYELEITGGSDYCGFPMRKDVSGIVRKRILAIQGSGLRKKIKITKKGERKIRRKFTGMRQRKTVAGNTIHDNTSQINVNVLKMGKEDVFKAGAAPKEEEKGSAKAEAPAEEKKPEAKKEEVKEEAPKEEKKPELKKEEKKPEEKKRKINNYG